MKSLAILKLGVLNRDKATQLTGALTHYSLGMGGNEYYLFVPYGINPDTGLPTAGFWVEAKRIRSITGGDPEAVAVRLPVEVLGTRVEDELSGFAGMAIALNLHINGCVHCEIQPEGHLKDGNRIPTNDVDYRRLRGPAITAMTEAEKEADQLARPSPAPAPRGPWA